MYDTIIRLDMQCAENVPVFLDERRKSTVLGKSSVINQ